MSRLFDRIKETISKLTPVPIYEPGKEPGIPGDKPPPEEIVEVKRVSYINEASMINLIRKCAHRRLLVQMEYNNSWRYVEPYSFRNGKSGTLFYGHCLTHNQIHSFYITKIQEVKSTEIPFNPRWIVEL
jgi:predicted DNA-binding transcriptional regulator YafY